MLRSPTKVINKILPIADTQQTTGNLFPTGLRCHRHQTSIRKRLEEIRTTEPVTSALNTCRQAWTVKIPLKVLFHDERWQSKAMMGQVSPQSSWKQANWRDKEGKCTYKRRGYAAQKGDQKIEREELEKK